MSSRVSSQGSPQTSVSALPIHSHACLIYEDEAEQLATTVSYLKEGLQRGEKCILLTNRRVSEATLAAVAAEGVDVGAAIDHGALVTANGMGDISSKTFAPLEMAHWLVKNATEAVGRGFPALRLTVEMDWFLLDNPGIDQVMAYEAELNHFFEKYPALAICQYSQPCFTPEVIQSIIYNHPLLIVDGFVSRNFFYKPPDEFLAPHDSRRSVRRMLSAVTSRELEDTRLINDKIVSERLNKQLQQEIAKRRRIEGEVRRLNAELEHRVAERTAQLETSNQEMEAFCHAISHDLRAPLSRQEGFCQALLDDCADGLGEEGRYFVERICYASRQLKELIDALLGLSRLASYELEVSEVDLTAIAHAVVGQLVREGQRDVQFDIAPDVHARGDARLLRLVLESLIGNAWKFTARQPAACIAFGVSEEEGRRVYNVRDNGAGFEMEFAGQLFIPFRRLHGVQDFPGIGIGLASVKRIIERHGGQVWAHGAVGQGATFSFTLGN